MEWQDGSAVDATLFGVASRHHSFEWPLRRRWLAMMPLPSGPRHPNEGAPWRGRNPPHKTPSRCMALAYFPLLVCGQSDPAAPSADPACPVHADGSFCARPH